MEIKKANRSLARIRLALQGPAGSGKTYSALNIAYGLCNDWKRIVVIDTQNRASEIYSHLGMYNVLNMNAPFSPESYIEAIDKAENFGADVIIIDTISEEWEGEGGYLETLSKMVGNSYNNFIKLKPKHNAFIKRILASGKHIIVTVRTKHEYVLTDNNGKSTIMKLGTKAFQNESYDYDFTTIFELDLNNNATCIKDRSQLFTNMQVYKLNENIGAKIARWCKDVEGYSQEEIENMIRACKTNEELNNLYKHTPCVRSFVSELNHRAAVIKGTIPEYEHLRNKNHETA